MQFCSSTKYGFLPFQRMDDKTKNVRFSRLSRTVSLYRAVHIQYVKMLYANTAQLVYNSYTLSMVCDS